MQQQILVLLVRLAVVASLASILVRLGPFKRMLLREERTLNQRLVLALSFSSVFGTGVAFRIVQRYQPLDLGVEGSLLAGMIGGYVTGATSGLLISIPAMIHGEFLTMPLLVGVGALGGLLRAGAPDTEEIWRFSPFIDLSLYRLFRPRRGHDRMRAAYQIVVVLAIVFAEFLRLTFGHLWPRRMFSLYPHWPHPNALIFVAIYATTLFAVMLPLKIWNAARNETKLEEQQRLLLEARMDALSRQINPHFLFNTLNSVSSLIRTNPQQARAVVYKLSNILRRLLRKHENFAPLSEELDFINDYLSIEMIRFGDKLRFEKEVDPASLDRLVPSMLLQPLIENCVKHGLSNKVEGGMVRFQSSLKDGRLHLLVEDDGIGIPEAKLATLRERGVGFSNVNERLKVLFGADYRIRIESKPSQGTRVEIDIPELQSVLAPVS